MCPSSGEITVSVRHLVLAILYGWLSGRQDGHPAYQSSTQSDKYQVSHRYSYCSWWRAHSCPKRVEKRNKHTKKNCAPSWLYLQYYTRMHGQQNIFNIHRSVHRNNILLYKSQQDAHITEFILSDNRSTCFGHHYHPSLAAQTTVTTASGNCYTILLSVAMIAADNNMV